MSALVLGLSLVLAGCMSPVAMHRAILEYDRTVSQVEAEMLLLNLARARHHHPLHFTVTSNVAATFDFRSSAGIVGQSLTGTVPGAFFPVIGVTTGESPTVAIIPIQGEEFTQRILAPLDERKFEFLYHRGANLSLLLRLMASGISIDREGTDHPVVLPNFPSRSEGYREFRRIVMHLAWLHAEHQLHFGPLLYEEVWPLPTEHPLTAQALSQGFRWSRIGTEPKPILSRQVAGRFVISNYDPALLSNEERLKLQEEAQRYARDQILVDIHAGYPGGDYPLRGRIQLRSFEAILRFIASGIAEEPEFDVEPDQRTGVIPRNPARTLEIKETEAPPVEAVFSVAYAGHWYSILAKGERSDWSLAGFRVLYQLFQLSVSAIGQKPTFPITIGK